MSVSVFRHTSTERERSSTSGIVGPSGPMDSKARLRHLLSLGAKERARLQGTGIPPPMEPTGPRPHDAALAGIRKARLLPKVITNPIPIPETLPKTGPNHGRLLIGELDDLVLVSCGSLLPEVQARKTMLSGMHFALLTEMLQWGTGNCEWDFGGGEYEEVQEMHMADAYSALKATLRPYGDSSAEPGIEVGFDKFSEWEEHIASIFPTKGTDYDPVIVREQTLDHTVKGCATAGGGDTTHIHGMKWHVIDMDLVALEQWSRRIESRAKMRFNRLYYTFRNLSEEDYDATEKVDQEYMATRNAY
jgi:hypothetical protein